MHSGMIGKIEKAHRYVDERGRFRFTGLRVTVHGDNSDHMVTLDGARWTCDCEFFGHSGACAHTMALGLMLQGMVPEPGLVAAVA